MAADDGNPSWDDGIENDLDAWDREFRQRAGFAPDGGLATAAKRLDALTSVFGVIRVEYDDRSALWTVCLARFAFEGGSSKPWQAIAHNASLDAAITQATTEYETNKEPL